MTKRLTGKRIWITGASSGFGSATATLLASEGAEVILSARRADRIEALAQEIRKTGATAHVKPLDVTDRAAAEQVGKELEELGGVHVLINNAGVMPLSPLLEGRVDEWDQTIDVNIKGLLYTTHAVLAGMARRKDGHIVNIGSVASQFSFAGGAVYSGTKFAVRGITDGLRREALNYGVRVTVIEPGAAATELTDGIKDEGMRKAVTAPGSFYAPDAKILQDVDVAQAILYVVTQPLHVNIGELMLRPTIQEF
jgi:NADP-dependent 3-hydroxy acid dehydrogenase YdfG